MRELSLNIMDVVQNSIVAKAALIEIDLSFDSNKNTLLISIADNGSGMTTEQVENVQSPFYTTRTTRKIGLGVPLFKMAAEQTGGTFDISSTLGEGTDVRALFHTDHIDMMPLGDISETILLLYSCNPTIDFRYTKTIFGDTVTLDTRELREVLGEDVPLDSPDVVAWVRDFLKESDGQSADGSPTANSAKLQEDHITQMLGSKLLASIKDKTKPDAPI